LPAAVSSQNIRTAIELAFGSIRADLEHLVRIPSVSAEGHDPWMVRHSAEETAAWLERSGLQDVRLLDVPGAHPAVFGHTSGPAGSPTVLLYAHHDVQPPGDEKLWNSPAFEPTERGGRLFGRGTADDKAGIAVHAATLQAWRELHGGPPVNVSVFIEGEEEIASPHFREVVMHPEVLPELRKCIGVFVPEAGQDRDGGVEVLLGAKGVVELELVSSGEKWGRGPAHDVHSSLEAQVDSPTWHLVQALNTLVEKDGHTPAVEGFFDKVKPLNAVQLQMVQEHAAKTAESTVKQVLGVQHWVHDANWQDSLALLVSKPTINIEGLVAGYTGPGGKTVLPHRAVAKIDMRLVPDMTAADTLAKLQAHLAAKGFPDIEVNMSGGYNPTETDPNSKLIQAHLATYRRLGLDPQLWPRSAGSWPGCIFTEAPVSLPAGHYGLGHGAGAHAPDEYYLIESANPKVQGLDGAIASFVEYLYALA